MVLTVFLPLIFFFYEKTCVVCKHFVNDRTGMWRKHSQEGSWRLFKIHLYLWQINEKAESLFLKTQDSSLQRLLDSLRFWWVFFRRVSSTVSSCNWFFSFQLLELQACCLFGDKVKNNLMQTKVIFWLLHYSF